MVTMDNVGMIAVVQGLQNAGLAVTLLDGNRQYTLMPQTGTVDNACPKAQYHAVPNKSSVNQSTSTAVDTAPSSGVRCDSCTQATDGRYVSIYQTSHCNVIPTSPPVQLSEFPPQRAEPCTGHDNFEVSGYGRKETRCSSTRAPVNYRGSMSSSDRGSMCSPRTSHESNAFANSLRKYPTLNRSSEIVEKLINYAQSKNSTKTLSRYISPVRSGGDSDTNHTCLENNPPRNTITKSRHTDDDGDDLRAKLRADESPTRDLRPWNKNLDCRSTIYKNAEVAMSHSSCASNTFQGSEGGVFQQLPITNSMDENESSNITVLSFQTPISSTNLLTSAHNYNCAAAKQLKRIESEKILLKQYIQEIILEILDNAIVKYNDKPKDITKEDILRIMCLKLQKLSESFDQNNKENYVFNLRRKLRDMPVWIPMSYDFKKINEHSGGLVNRTKKVKVESEVFYAALAPHRRLHNEVAPHARLNNEEDIIEDLVKDWVNDIPIKYHDFIGKPVERLRITDALVRKLLKLFSNKSRYYDISMLKRKIINMITNAPLDVSASKRHNLTIKLVDILINKIKDVSPHVLKKSNSLEAVTNRYNHKTDFVHSTNKLLKPSEAQLTELLFKELKELKEKSHINICPKLMSEIITELIDILLNSTRDLHFDNDNNVKEDIAVFLTNTGLFSSQQVNYFAKHLLELLKTSFGHTKIKWNNRNFFVLENILTRTDESARLNESTGQEEITQGDIIKNLDAYLNELCYQIDEWLTNLPVKIPQVNERHLRKDVIYDLARDIVDRHRYLELTANHKESEGEELEYLKYQIFKCIKKLVGEEQQETIAHAPDLMKRIKNIPILMLTKPNQNTNNSPEKEQLIASNSENVALNLLSKVNVSNQTIQENTLESSQAHSLYNNHSTSLQPSVKDLNEEYDKFVKSWVQQIPIPTLNYKEQEKARMRIYNGIWKAVTKLKFDPIVFHNEFYYQDMLDIEIEKLLDALPKTDELNAKKYLLKVTIIEKTTNMNKIIKSTIERASYKQQLIENVLNNILSQTVADNVVNNTKINEEPQILNIVENYILYTKFNKEDKVKASVYRKKLLKDIEAFVGELKKSHGQKLINVDPRIYMTDILDALHKVPLPSEKAMKEEGDEILLGIEIEQWLSDLPIVLDNNNSEQLNRRRLREALGKKILEIQKNNNLIECSLESAVKDEILRFMRKIPLQQNESFNINFMADELLNRIKNKVKESKKKSVSFQDLPNYDRFDRDLLHCSSFIGESGRIPYQANPRFCSSYNDESARMSQQPSSQFQTNTSGFIQYNPIPSQETEYAPPIITGSGLANTSRAIPNLDQSYMTFDQYRPVSSSLRDDGGNNYRRYVNQTSSSSDVANQPEPIWLTLEETKNPLYVQLQPTRTEKYQSTQGYQSQVPFGSGNEPNPVRVTLKDSESLYHGQPDQYQSQQFQIPQQHQSFEQYRRMYVDGTNRRSRDSSTTQNQVGVHDDSPTNHTSKLQNSFGIHDHQSLAPSQIATGHAVDKVCDQSDIAQTNNCYQAPTTSDSGNMKQENIRCTRPMVTVTSESHGQIPSIPVTIPLETICSQRPCRTKENGSSSQTLNSMPEVFALRREQALPYKHYAQLQVPVGATGKNANTQYYQSSYGYPQGFSTPHEEINRDIPPKIVKKRVRESNRPRKAFMRKKLELDDSEVDETDEEECRCLERMWRRRMSYCKDKECDINHSCIRMNYYMPMPFPYPYFF